MWKFTWNVRKRSHEKMLKKLLIIQNYKKVLKTVNIYHILWKKYWNLVTFWNESAKNPYFFSHKTYEIGAKTSRNVSFIHWKSEFFSKFRPYFAQAFVYFYFVPKIKLRTTPPPLTKTFLTISNVNILSISFHLPSWELIVSPN